MRGKPCDFHEIYVSGKNTTYYYNRNIYITEYQYYKVFVQVILSTFSAICWHIIDTATRPLAACVRLCLPMPRFPGQSDG